MNVPVGGKSVLRMLFLHMYIGVIFVYFVGKAAINCAFSLLLNW
jgi:hypothetical protein